MMMLYDFKLMKSIKVNYAESLTGGFLIRLPLIYEEYIRSCIMDRPSVKSSYVRDMAFDTLKHHQANHSNIIYLSCQIQGFEIDRDRNCDELLVYYIYDHFIENTSEYFRNKRECILNDLL